MEKGRSSETAMLAAVSRAAHPLIDSEPWVLKDDFAAPFANIDSAADVLGVLNAFQTELQRTSPADIAREWMRSMRAIITLRARYAEDELQKAIERGISQYVILGCGFDSFAYRRPDLASVLRVFEVDHPETQRRKKERLRELGTAIPPHVAFVPVDFETDSILERLESGGFRREKPTFLSWLGVTGYLTDEAVFSTLAQIAQVAPGSELVLDYGVPEALLTDSDRQTLRMIESFTASRGEPRRGSCFEPADLAKRLASLGFADIQDFSPDEANARYLSGRTDGLRFPAYVRLMKARMNGAPVASRPS
jgi:methyltransferase (TIGR00027 family)